MDYDWDNFHILRKKEVDGTISEEESKELAILNAEALRQDEIAAQRQREALKPIIEKHTQYLKVLESIVHRLEKAIEKFEK